MPHDIAAVKTLADIERFERTPWQQRLPALTTYGLLRATCERHCERIALRLLLAPNADAPTRDLRYAGLLEGVHRTANALHACGLAPGAAVTLLLPNLIESHFALWGAQAAGIASPVNPMLEAAYIARICEETKAEVVVALGPAPGSDLWDKAVQVAERVRSVHTVLQVNLDGALGRCEASAPAGPMPARDGVQVLDFHQALAAARADRLDFDRTLSPDEPCAYFHTGGTTGYPKVAVHTHVNEAFMACAIQWIDDRDDVVLSGLPLFHVNGALVTGLGAFHRGAEVVVLTPGGYRSPGLLDAFWQIARRFNATTFSAVPTVLASLLDKPWPGGGVPTLRHVLCGAAPLPRQVALDFERLTGASIHEGYGLTEGSCVSTVNLPRGRRQLGTVGLRLPYQEIKLFALGADGKPTGELARPDGAGVIGLRGPNVFPGYLRESDNQGIWIEGGWFNTGDLGRWDDAEYLVLCGRAKDLIIRGGHNIDPQLIEDALVAHPAVAMAAAVGQPDRHAGELPVAYVALRAGSHASVEDLRTHALVRIPERAAVPVRIEVLPALPLTTVGKVSKPHLRLMALERVLREALDAEGLAEVRASSRLTAGGVAVELSGPASHRSAALALAGRYPVSAQWPESAA
ncbi:acyl-CoA synthetase [Piscinibacter sp. XHJ-5]|uniref:acyl-CoA synthetase n=1 Tax=Piscinibacter sp. XHJ-5 TaxID=3037797 RepID=UPI00245285C9|nr:acyl-CoA synthetase [Piscinibacter sp. XHJ-5]